MSIIIIENINKYKLGEISPEYIRIGKKFTYVEPNFVAIITITDKINNKDSFTAKVIASVGKHYPFKHISLESGYNNPKECSKIYPLEKFFEHSLEWFMKSKEIVQELSNIILNECPTIGRKLHDEWEWAKLISLKLFSNAYQSQDDQYDFIKENNTLFKNHLSNEELFTIWQMNLKEVVMEKSIKNEAIINLNYRLNYLLNNDLTDSYNNWYHLRGEIDRLRNEGFDFQKDNSINTSILDPKHFFFNSVYQSAYNTILMQNNIKVGEYEKDLYLIGNKMCEAIAKTYDKIDFTNYFKCSSNNIIHYQIIEDYALKLYLNTKIQSYCVI
jgi:hypothetical protein